MSFDLSGCVLRAQATVQSPSLSGLMRRSMTVLAALALLPVNGCLGHHYVRTDFKSYESAYADTSNREMLLNLARLENRSPTYFFKLGQITSTYRMQGSLTTNGQLSSSGNAVQIPVGGGSPGVVLENDPTFQFIPVNDDTNAQLLLRPIPQETFYILYQQGWRVDQLFRLLVDRIEITRTVSRKVNSDGSVTQTCQVETIRNEVPTSWATPEDQAALSRYVTFLRVSALVYELQKRGILLLRGKESFVPYDDKAVISGAGPSPAKPGQAVGAGSPAPGADLIKPSDQNEAIAKNNLWRLTDKGWVLGHKIFTPVFYLSPVTEDVAADGTVTYSSSKGNVEKELTEDLSDPDALEALSMGPALDNMLTILSQGFSLEGAPSPEEEKRVCPATGIAAHLVLRSMVGLMSAAAQEQKPFMALAAADPVVPANPLEAASAAGQQPLPEERFDQEVPPFERIPLMRLTWSGDEDLTHAVVRVMYQDQEYTVADPKKVVALGGSSNTPIPQDENWNRDMFRLIEGLTSQVTVDISKFPPPELLQLHSD